MFDMGESTVRLLLFWGGLLVFLALELTIPYREPSVSKKRRWIDNLGLTVFNSIVLRLAFGAAVVGTAAYAEKEGVGVLRLLDVPLWVQVLLAVVFMDFILYVWHLLNHKVPLLWRFHRVHHADLNMDVTTATRFHIGELAPSAVIKIGLIYLLGATVPAVVIFESLIVLCAQFHHSSLRVSESFERFYWLFFVPPSMHRIHHSVKIRERDSNYGVIFSLWDRFLETLVLDVNQEGITIGLGAYRRPERLRLHHLMLMPFTRPVP
ncbi:MAG: sterol desaturase family protein [Deltaproteobacteria bacterium]|nr:sterol desaturase family protein [Deltaproteobacteria bacterium]